MKLSGMSPSYEYLYVPILLWDFWFSSTSKQVSISTDFHSDKLSLYEYQGKKQFSLKQILGLKNEDQCFKTYLGTY